MMHTTVRKTRGLLVGLTWLLAIGVLPAPAASAGHTPTETEAIAQADTVERAFDLLVDHYVHPLSSAAVLQAGWAQLQDTAAHDNAPAPGPAPVLVDDPQTDLATFRSRLVTYLESGAAFPDDFVAAHAAVAGMARSVDERHTYFLTPDQYRERREWASGTVVYGGIGVHFTAPGLLVTEVEEASPAERAGVEPGDMILQVGTESVAELPPRVALDRLRGPVGSVAELMVRARHDGPTRSVSLVREQVHVDTVVGRRIGDIGYIRVRGFPEPSLVDDFNGLLTTFVDADVRGLIVDLRGNVGGRLDLGTRLLADFLPAGTPVFNLVDRDGGSQPRVVGDDGIRWERPVVVLIDDRTESMGEIFAAALHEQRVATLVGTTTNGDVAGGLLYPLADGSALDVTVYEITGADGVILNRVGVAPDVLVSGTRATSEHGEDPVLQRALEVLAAAR